MHQTRWAHLYSKLPYLTHIAVFLLYPSVLWSSSHPSHQIMNLQHSYIY